MTAMLAGLRKAHKKKEMRVVWLIRQDLPSEHPVKNADFVHVTQWAPQTELLNHPAVKAGLTHCGFGGVLEFVAAGVPVLTFPHFSD